MIYHSWPATRNNGWIFGVGLFAAANLWPHPWATASAYNGASVRPHHLEDCPRRIVAPSFSARNSLACPERARQAHEPDICRGMLTKTETKQCDHAFHRKTDLHTCGLGTTARRSEEERRLDEDT